MPPSPSAPLPPPSRAAFARVFLSDRRGTPWIVRPYQRASLESDAARKVHCDGRDVGKTAEIEITACWAAVHRPGTEMMIATQFENHLSPLMHRLHRRFTGTPFFAELLAECRRSPSWSFRFENGFQLWGRIAGPRGVNFQGMHVDWQIVDEAQEMAETSWAELFQSLNGGGRRWVYGVPNGLRNTFYRMTQDPSIERHHWPSSLNPDFTPEKDAELVRLYGGPASPGYLHRVLGLHGEPAAAVFSLEDYLACVDPSLRAPDRVLREDEPFAPPPPPGPGAYYLGADLGYARDPSEFVIYRDASPHLVGVFRLRLEGVNYARQESVIMDLDRRWRFAGLGIDAGNNGRAVAHRLMALGGDWCSRVHAYDFGGVLDTATLPDGTPARRHTKEFMTDLLRRRMAERTLVFPPCPDREAEYASHTYTLGARGRVLFDKGGDHLIDADRCAVLRHWFATAEAPAVPAAPPPLIMGF